MGMTRSEIMSRIRSAETGPERELRATLRSLGIRGYRKNWGRPSVDVAFVGKRVAVFVDSCFWHGCPRHGKIPRTNGGWWAEKIRRNRARDAKATRHYRRLGWTVMRFWTHDQVGGQALCVAAEMG